MTLRQLIPLVAFVAVPFAVLYGFGRLSRWYLGRRDPIGALIKAPKWCEDGRGGWMNTVDSQKAERAGERRWQEALRAQRKARKPAQKPPKNLVQMPGTRRSA